LKDTQETAEMEKSNYLEASWLQCHFQDHYCIYFPMCAAIVKEENYDKRSSQTSFSCTSYFFYPWKASSAEKRQQRSLLDHSKTPVRWMKRHATFCLLPMTPCRAPSVTHNRQISHARGPNCPPLVAQGYGD
jgi:hypothetical protein